MNPEEFGRAPTTPKEKAELDQIRNSLKVSSYLDDVFEQIHRGVKPVTHVPNYNTADDANESHGVNLDFNGIYANASNNMTDEQMTTAMNDAYPEQDKQTTFANSESNSVSASASASASSNTPRFVVSRNQAMAIKKYPTLVEFLGQPNGENIAKKIMEHMNTHLAEIINANSKEANEFAVACKSDKQNLKQYFKSDDWLCRVTASGPFRGDEAIYYSPDKDLACVLRKIADGDKIQYADISSQFNIIYEAERGEISVLAEEKIAEESEEQPTSTEKEEENVDQIEISDSEEIT